MAKQVKQVTKEVIKEKLLESSAPDQITSAGLIEIKEKYEDALKRRNEVDAELAEIQATLRTYYKEARKLNETVADMISGTAIGKEDIIDISALTDDISFNASGIKDFIINWLIPILILIGVVWWGLSTGSKPKENTRTIDNIEYDMCMDNSLNHNIFEVL